MKLWKSRGLWRWLLLAAVGVTTAVIWYLSLRPGQTSVQQSDQMTLPLIQATTAGGDVFDMLIVFVRKMAHFIEFFGLGFLWALYSRVRPRPLPFAWLYGLLVALADEALQGITPGRAPGLMDVVLDYCGYFCGFALVFSVADWLLRRKIRKQRK